MDTIKHIFRDDNLSDDDDCLTTTVGNKVYMLFRTNDSPQKLKLFVMKTDTLKLKKVDCELLENIEKNPSILTSDRHYIYIVLDAQPAHIVQRHELYILNTRTSQCKFVMHFKTNAVKQSIEMIGNKMYRLYMEIPRRGSKKHWLYLQITNLTSKTSKRKVVCKFSDYDSFNVHSHLIKNNDKLYALIRNNFSDEIITFRIGRKRMVQLRYLYSNNVKGMHLFCDYIHVNNNVVHARWVCKEDLSHGYVLHIDIFNFKTNKWNKILIKNFLFHRAIPLMKSVIVMNNMAFFLTLERKKMVLSITEIAPKLSTICMEQLIYTSNGNGVFDSIKEKLSIPLRTKLDGMLSWKPADNMKEWKKAQKVEVVQEIWNMDVDQTIDHTLKRELRTVFDSDFSDESDSDKSEGEDELHEVLDDDVERRDKEADERTMWWSDQGHRPKCMPFV